MVLARLFITKKQWQKIPKAALKYETILQELGIEGEEIDPEAFG